MPGPLIYVGKHAIKEDKGDLARAASQQMASFVEENHSRFLHFQLNISPDGREMTVLQVHPDEESMGLHMQLAGEKIKAAYEFLDKTTDIQIFGDPSEAFTAQIHQMSMGAPVTIHRTEFGFTRLSAVRV
jgi:hypothetical protein